ncbi:hypothetical protein D3C78_1289850 [compost metagenome]
MHQLQTFDPTGDHAANRQIDRRTALDGAVEHRAIDQLALVVHADHVVGLGLCTVGLLEDFILQAGSGGHHAFALAIVLEELLAGLGVLVAERRHALLGTLLQETEGFHQLFVGQTLLFLRHGILDAEGDRLGVEIVHAFLGQTAAHVQTDTVGGFLCRGLELLRLLGRLLVAAGEDQADQSHRSGQPMMFHAYSLMIGATAAYSENASLAG